MFDFPNSPTVGQAATMPDGTSRVWDGAKWVAGATSPSLGVTVSDTAPSSPNNGQMWWDSTGAQLYLWYQDPSSNQWVPASNTSPSSTITVSDTAPSSPASGTLWWDSTGGQLYLWYVDPNTSQWVPASNQAGALAEAPTDGGAYLRQNSAWAATSQADVGRNKLHNALFNIQQRGAGAVTTTNAYTADRWMLALTTDTASVTPPALADADRTSIGDEEAAYCLQNVFTGNAAAGAFNMIVQRIENVRRLANKTITVSFWAKASATLKLGVCWAQNFGSGGSAAVNGTGNAITLSTTWTRYSTSFVLPSTSGKTLGTAGDHTQFEFWFSSGSTYASRAGNIGVQSGTVQLWGVQLEIGSVATPLEKPDIRYDFANCQRFFQTSSFIGSAWAGVVSSPTGWFAISLATMMRAVPTVNIAGQSYGTGAGGLAVNGATASVILLQFNVTAASSANTWAQGSFTASADL